MLQMRDVRSLKRQRNDIAIVGMSGRFPGASNLDEFWSNLSNGVDSIVDTTDDDLRRLGLDPQRIHPDSPR